MAMFYPEIWAKELNVALRKTLVGANLVNRNYEGEIQVGNTLNIIRPSAMTIEDYTAGTDITGQVTAETKLQLIITQAKAFGITVDDTVLKGSGRDLSTIFTAEAAVALVEAADTFIMSKYADADSSNLITNVAITESNVYETLVSAGKKLNLNSVPAEGRWVVLSPEEVAALSSSTKFTSADALGAEVRRAGFSGKAAGFDVYMSNNIAVSTVTVPVRHLLYGNNSAITFADQINNVETSRLPKQFADFIKGLHVYGAKVVEPKALGVIRSIV